MAWTWGSHHLPRYSILYAWPRGLHPNVILSQDFQIGSPEILEIGTLVILKANNFFVKTSNWSEVQSKAIIFVKIFPTVFGMPPSCK